MLEADGLLGRAAPGAPDVVAKPDKSAVGTVNRESED